MIGRVREDDMQQRAEARIRTVASVYGVPAQAGELLSSLSMQSKP